MALPALLSVRIARTILNKKRLRGRFLLVSPLAIRALAAAGGRAPVAVRLALRVSL